MNIGKANAEIERLNAEVATLTKERDDARAALESNNSEVGKQAESLQGQLTAANQSISDLNAQVTALKADLASKEKSLAAVESELKAAQEKLANSGEQIKQAASLKAAEITGAQGQPPVVVPVAETPAQSSAKTENLFGIARVIAAFKAESLSKQTKN